MASLPLLSSLQAFNHLMEDNPYVQNLGLQLWTVREQMAEDPTATLKVISQLGYKHVEPMSVPSYKEIKPYIQDAGLEVFSCFIQWPVITGRWDLLGYQEAPYNFDQLLENAQKIGLKHIVFGYLRPEERSHPDHYKRLCEQLNAAGEKSKQEGIQLCYHNHNFEFEELKGMIPYDYLMQNLDHDLVKFELDVFWASVAGLDPVDIMRKLEGRIAQLHLKDKKRGAMDLTDESKVPPDYFEELGQGEVDLWRILEVAAEIGVEYCHVEQDHSPDPIRSIGESIYYLNQS